MSLHTDRDRSEPIGASRGTSPGRHLRGLVVRALLAGRARFRALAPGWYAPGDMRRAYRWRGAVALAVTAFALWVGGRLALSWAFAAAVSPDPGLLAAFNLAVTAGLGGTVLAGTVVRGRLRRRRVRRRLAPDERGRL
ncbi:MAG: hypothetical protein ABEJ31_00365 [Haloarculaceae archaeon]